MSCAGRTECVYLQLTWTLVQLETFTVAYSHEPPHEGILPRRYSSDRSPNMH